MASETPAQLHERIQKLVSPGFRQRLLDRGLARNFIWNRGRLPVDAPPFSESLTSDLLDYGHGLLALALRLRRLDQSNDLLPAAFLKAGEALESVVVKGDSERVDHGINLLGAAAAFHLGGYSARAYSILPADQTSLNLSPGERVLSALLRRALPDLHELYRDWLTEDDHQDGTLAKSLALEDGPSGDEAVNIILTSAYMRAIAFFDHAIQTGSSTSMSRSQTGLKDVSAAAAELHFVTHWWLSEISQHLLQELWNCSLHAGLPAIDEPLKWNALRADYIARLRAQTLAAIELWPSQLEAARRAIDPTDSLVVSLPTSAGKTRIAELCILRALASEKRIVYVTPLRALSAQVEASLSTTFEPLGYRVSGLFGSAPVEQVDEETLLNEEIVVATPEKLDFAIRNRPDVLDDVGLIVLDEGHMLGPGEREVRYEALVQRLLQREDSGSRRIVCLSALFPSESGMTEFVEWLRKDVPGRPVISSWRPTRQRFGTIRWENDHARLDVEVEQEKSFVPRFVEQSAPPAGSRRRKLFPSDKNELTLASAWRFVSEGKTTLIYCPLRSSVENVARLVENLCRKGFLRSVLETPGTAQEAIASGVEWLGPEHPAVLCLKYGVAVHHAGLPRQFLNEVEKGLKRQIFKVIIASPTLAQGLNLSANVVIFPSIWRNQEIIPPAEFANVAGRAGRAFVDLEGVIVHVVHEDTTSKAKFAIRRWNNLIERSKERELKSGILRLAEKLFRLVALARGGDINETIEILASQLATWRFDGRRDASVTENEWERDVASLDAALFALLDPSTDTASLERSFSDVLAGSLFLRQIGQLEDFLRGLIPQFLMARAKLIWSQTSSLQRRGYFLGGIGLSAGQFLDLHNDTLFPSLIQAEQGIESGASDDTVSGILAIAELVFQTSPFRPKTLPENWKVILRSWILGEPASLTLGTEPEDAVEFIQDGIVYRLAWALEAIRVQNDVNDENSAGLIRGTAAAALQAGTLNRAAMILLRAGLSSREAAISAAVKGEARFSTWEEMKSWLTSEPVLIASEQEDWPTRSSRDAWLSFVTKLKSSDRGKWIRRKLTARVEWDKGRKPPVGTDVRVSGAGLEKAVYDPGFSRLGTVLRVPAYPAERVISATVGEDPNTVTIEWFGPWQGPR